MADKDKKNKLQSLLLKIFGCLIGSVAVSIFLSMIIASYIEYREVSFSSLGGALSTNTFITAFPVCILVCLLGCLLIFTGTKSSGGKEMKGKEDLENQHFMSTDELDKDLKHVYFGDLYKFSYDGWPVRSKVTGKQMKIHFGPNYHMLIVGATGSGKTATYLEPTIQILSETKTKPSMFITDTKGELFSHHSQKLLDMGYDVKVVDLTDPYRSIQWNPLESVYTNYQKSFHLKEEVLVHSNDDVSRYNFIKVGDINNQKWYEFQNKAFATLEQTLAEVEVERNKLIDTCYSDLQDIASALCPIENQKDPGWEQGARDYILAVLVAMLEDSENPALGMTKEKYNFYNMYKLVMNKDNDFETMTNYFRGRSPLSKTRQLIGHIVDSKAKQTRDSYMSTIANKLSMFSDNGINYLTSRNEINFYDFDEHPTAFFIKIPDENKTRYTLASVCVGQAYKEFVRKARDNEFKKDGKACLSRPLYYLMDEFANLPPISNIGTMITVSRSRRIYFAMVIQSYSQLKGTYGEDVMNTIRGNCNGEIYVGTSDQYTREEFSKKLGNYTIKVDSKTAAKGADGKPSDSISSSYQSRPLVYPSDLAHIKHGHFYAYIYPLYPIDSYMETIYSAQSFFKFQKMDEPFVPGKRFNEDAVYYDVEQRNKIVLGY